MIWDRRELFPIFCSFCSNGCFLPEKEQEMTDLSEECASECDDDDRAAMRNEPNLLEISEASITPLSIPNLELKRRQNKSFTKFQI